MSSLTLQPSALSLSAIILNVLMVILLSFVVVAKTSNLDWLQFVHWNPVKYVLLFLHYTHHISGNTTWLALFFSSSIFLCMLFTT